MSRENFGENQALLTFSSSIPKKQALEIMLNFVLTHWWVHLPLFELKENYSKVSKVGGFLNLGFPKWTSDLEACNTIAFK